MCCVHGTIFALACALFIGADARKPKKQNDLLVLVEIQGLWKSFWKNATSDVATKCKANCDWTTYYHNELQLREASQELIKRAPEYKSTLGGMLQMSRRGLNPSAHNANCRPSHAHGRDDFCICARDHKDWQIDCDYALDTHSCQKFLGTVCDISFSQEEEEIKLSEGQDLGERYKNIMASKREQEQENSQEEAGDLTNTQKQIKRLQKVLADLDQERDHLIAAHETTTKNMKWRPMLAKLDQRIKNQKDKVYQDIQALLEKRAVEVEQDKSKDL